MGGKSSGQDRHGRRASEKGCREPVVAGVVHFHLWREKDSRLKVFDVRQAFSTFQ
jgi:hypothetical protein